MKPRIAIAVVASLVAVSSGALAACPPVHPKKSQADKPRPHADNCIDLNAVPQIGAQIVAREPAPAKPRGYEPTSPTRYEGPTVGLTKPEPSARPAPTVGYKWNLE